MKCLFASNSQSTVSQSLSANTAGRLAKAIQLTGKIHPKLMPLLMCDEDGEAESNGMEWGWAHTSPPLQMISLLAPLPTKHLPQARACTVLPNRPIFSHIPAPAIYFLPSELPNPGQDSCYLPPCSISSNSYYTGSKTNHKAPKPLPFRISGWQQFQVF